MKNAERLICIALVALILTFSPSCSGGVVKTKELSQNITQTTVIQESKLEKNADYKKFLSAFSQDITVPGLFEGLIPQGICFDSENGNIIISGYYEKGELPSMLCIVNADTKKLLKSVKIETENGSVYTGHAGGLASSDGYIYITSDGEAMVIKKSDLYSTENSKEVKVTSNFKLNTDGSFANVTNGVLWAGTFSENSKKVHSEADTVFTLPSGETFYAYCEGYILENGLPSVKKLNSENSGYIPDYYFAIPDEVQGMTVTKTGQFIFSSSYGRRNDSVIRVFDDITLSQTVGTANIDGVEIDLKAASSDILKTQYTAPPMAEGVDCYDGKLVLLFESGASKYRSHGGKYPSDMLFFAEFE